MIFLCYMNNYFLSFSLLGHWNSSMGGEPSWHCHGKPYPCHIASPESAGAGSDTAAAVKCPRPGHCHLSQQHHPDSNSCQETKHPRVSSKERGEPQPSLGCSVLGKSSAAVVHQGVNTHTRQDRLVDRVSLSQQILCLGQ